MSTSGTLPLRALSDESQRLKRRSVLVMVALFIVTLHLYAFYWYVNTTRALNRHVRVEIPARFMALCMSVTLLNFALAIASKAAGGWSEWPELARNILFTVDWLLWLLWTLRLRALLNEVARDPAPRASRVWWLPTYLFQLFYLQLKINQIVDARLIRGAPPL